MFKKILSGAGSALDYLFSHPKQVLIAFWTVVIVWAALWRLAQPFAPEQPALFFFGLVFFLAGVISWWLEKRDAMGVRTKALVISAAIMVIGIVLMSLGVLVKGV